jgi:hypothetical protein
MTADHMLIANLMERAIVMLTFAVEDVRHGRWNDVELGYLAKGLDPLVSALNGNRHADPDFVPMIIEAERGDQ